MHSIARQKLRCRYVEADYTTNKHEASRGLSATAEFLVYCPVLSCPGYTCFLATPPRSNPWTDFNIYGLNDASSPKDVPFGGLDDNP